MFDVAQKQLTCTIVTDFSMWKIKVIIYFVINTSLQVLQDDGLPQQVCEQCTSTLHISYTFRHQAKRADIELRRIILEQTTIKDEKIDIIENNLVENAHNDHQDYESYEPVSPKTELETHEQESEAYECTFCKKQYNDQKKYLKHQASHESEVTCRICNKTFKKKLSLEKHMVKHTSSHVCSVCCEEFKSQALLTQHMALHPKLKQEADDVNLFKCSVCGLGFSKSRSLGQHMKKHKKEKPFEAFICEYCNKEFTGKNSLRRHIKLHKQDRPYCCTKCPKKYPRQDQLADHLKKHSDIKPNVCPYCNKGKQFCYYFTFIAGINARLSLQWEVKVYGNPVLTCCFSYASVSRDHGTRKKSLKLQFVFRKQIYTS